MRHFIVSYLFTTPNQAIGIGHMTFRIENYPSFNEIKRNLDEKEGVACGLTPLNITEVSESDYNSFLRK